MSEVEESLESSRMTLGEHLEELRTRLIKSVLALVVTFAIGWGFRDVLARWTFQPYERAAAWLNVELVGVYEERLEQDPSASWEDYFTSADPETREVLPNLQVSEQLRGDAASHGFFFYIRVCFYFALFLGGPVVLWQLWQFVAAGLYQKERTVVARYFPFSVALFIGGVVFGYFTMVPYALFFLARMTLGQIHYWESLQNYWTFLTSLTLALGAVFQLPVVMLALARFGIVEPRTFARYRPHCIVGALVLAALLTPPDPFTQLLMAVPIVTLYELGHVLSRFAARSQAGTDES